MQFSICLLTALTLAAPVAKPAPGWKLGALLGTAVAVPTTALIMNHHYDKNRIDGHFETQQTVQQVTN